MSDRRWAPRRLRLGSALRLARTRRPCGRRPELARSGIVQNTARGSSAQATRPDHLNRSASPAATLIGSRTGGAAQRRRSRHHDQPRRLRHDRRGDDGGSSDDVNGGNGADLLTTGRRSRSASDDRLRRDRPERRGLHHRAGQPVSRIILPNEAPKGTRPLFVPQGYETREILGYCLVPGCEREGKPFTAGPGGAVAAACGWCARKHRDEIEARAVRHRESRAIFDPDNLGPGVEGASGEGRQADAARGPAGAPPEREVAMDEPPPDYPLAEKVEHLVQMVAALAARVDELEAKVLPQDPDPEIGLP